MCLDRYYLLGRSGLRVSPLALGTMTFGTERDWGSTEEVARGIFDHYLSLGGNFIDTADLYTGGTSETMIGKFIADAAVRDRVVLATKFTHSAEAGNPNASGNGRKNMMRAIEASLHRLRTDYVDLYLLHTWDRITPAEEVMRAFDDLLRAGKIRYAGLSNIPAWYAARAQTYAEAHALAPLITVQLQYSLIQRHIEHEFVPLAQILGMGITAWSPLGMGLLSGKYQPSKSGAKGDGRLAKMAATPGPNHFTERNWRVVSILDEVAKEANHTMAQVALNWVATQPGVGSVITGATSIKQLEENVSALDFELPAQLRRKLDQASTPESPSPYNLFTEEHQARLCGGAIVGDKPTGYANR